MVSPIVEAFSITHAEVLDGTKTFLEASLAKAHANAWDVYGVSNGSLEPDTDKYRNEGDDSVLSVWGWLNSARITIQAGYVSFPLIGTLTGQTVSSSGAGNAQVFGVDLWHEDSVNVAPQPMLLRCLSKDMDGVVRTLTVGIYKVSFEPITFDGPRFKDGLKINYAGEAILADKDEKGVVFADGKRRVGKLISHA